MAVLSPGALPARPTSTATRHDPSGFAGPHHAATRRRRPDVQRTSSRRARRVNVLRIDVFRERSSTPSRAPEGPQSFGNRSASTQLRSGTRARSPSPKSSKTPGRALTASRRRPTKTLEFASAAAVRGVEARPTHPLPRARVALRQNPAPGAPGGENHLPSSPSGAAVVGRLLLHRNSGRLHPRHQGATLITRM